MVKLVLFDIDGTLIQSGGAGLKAFKSVLETEFKIADGVEGLKFAGRTDISSVREIFCRHGVSPSQNNFRAFFEHYVLRLEVTMRECNGSICPGVHGFLNELRTMQLPPVVGLLTGNIRRGAEIKLNYFGLWHEFTIGAFADDHENRDIIAAVAKQRGIVHLGEELQGEEILVVGDTPLDIRCARSIDARVLAVSTGAATLDELCDYKPDWAISDLTKVSAADLCS